MLTILSGKAGTTVAIEFKSSYVLDFGGSEAILNDTWCLQLLRMRGCLSLISLHLHDCIHADFFRQSRSITHSPKTALF